MSSKDDNLTPSQQKRLDDIKEKRERDAFQQRKNERLEKLKKERIKEAQLVRREKSENPSNKNDNGVKTSSTLKKTLNASYLIIFWIIACILAWLLSTQTSDRFISKTEFTVIKDQKTQNISAAEILGFSTTGSSSDIKLIEKYIHSSDLLTALEKELKLTNHYSDQNKDWFFKLTADAHLEDRLEHYRKRIQIKADEQANTIEIKVDTYDPKFSQKINIRIFEETEKFINRLNKNIATKQKDLIKQELKASENSLLKSREDLLAIKKKFETVDYQQEVASRFALINSLKIKISTAEAKLQALTASFAGSAEIPDLRLMIKVHQEEIRKERSLLTGKQKEKLNKLMIDQEIATHEVTLNQKKFDANQELLNRTHLESIAQSRFLSMIQKPLLPDDSTQPQRVYLAFATLFIAFIIFIILRISYKSVMSH